MDMQCRPGQTLKSQQGSAHQKAPCQDVLVHKGEQWRGGGGFGFTGPRVETTRVGLQKKDTRAHFPKGRQTLESLLGAQLWEKWFDGMRCSLAVETRT